MSFLARSSEAITYACELAPLSVIHTGAIGAQKDGCFAVGVTTISVGSSTPPETRPSESPIRGMLRTETSGTKGGRESGKGVFAHLREHPTHERLCDPTRALQANVCLIRD